MAGIYVTRAIYTRPRNLDMSRFFSVLIVLPAIIFILPFVAIIAGLIYLSDKGNPIFAHKRIGRNGRVFLCYKFRTMYLDADQRLQKLLACDEAAKEEWETHRKLKNDPRIVGKLAYCLRRTGLDELPQIWNVLKGDMNLVGPRPVTREEIRRYKENANRILSLRPGITGKWQICEERNSLSYDERIALELSYVENQSLKEDLRILFATVRSVLAMDGC